MRRILIAFLVIPSICGAEVRFGTLPVVQSERKEEPKPTKHPDVSGLHSHWCDKCKLEWWHGPENLNNEAAHTCPKCKSIIWDIKSEGPKEIPKAATKAPIQGQTFQNCPGGNCPTPGRYEQRKRGFFLWK